MNADNIYLELRSQNDRLLTLKNRMRKTVARICGDAPPRPGPVATSPLTGAKPETHFLNELESVSSANSDIIADISNELLWLESTFGTSDTPGTPFEQESYPTGKAFR